ncbi:hypothetical protein LINPERHAP2_LOCUS25324, partial [Linum perenne]
PPPPRRDLHLPRRILVLQLRGARRIHRVSIWLGFASRPCFPDLPRQVALLLRQLRCHVQALAVGSTPAYSLPAACGRWRELAVGSRGVDCCAACTAVVSVCFSG